MKKYFPVEKAVNPTMHKNLNALNDFLNKYDHELSLFGFITNWEVKQVKIPHTDVPPFWRATFKLKTSNYLHTFNFDSIDKLKLDEDIILRKFDVYRIPGVYNIPYTDNMAPEDERDMAAQEEIENLAERLHFDQKVAAGEIEEL